MTTISKGSTLGSRYVLLEAIANGGMGEVWRAKDHRLGREVAVKVMRGEFGHDQITRERFRFEAQAAASLTSSGVATVFDYGEERSADGSHQAYIVMELVHGESLEQLVRRKGPLPAGQCLDIIRQAAVALQAAHDRGLIHRDIKPANLLLRTDGVVKLTDFGIARALDSSSLTQQGLVVGTVRYMSPEQLSGRPATPVSDLYALGVVAYFCLAGHTPFDYQESMAVALAHVHDPMPPLPAHIPDKVATFVSQMLAKDPGKRPSSAAAVAATALALTDAPLTSSTQPLVMESISDPNGDRNVTKADRRSTAVMAAPIAPGIDGHPPPRQRRHEWLVPAILGALLTAILAFWLLAGPGRVTVPRLQGMTAAAAETRVTHLGLSSRQHFVNADQKSGRVISQSPAPGASVAKGTPITLEIASGFENINAGELELQTPGQASTTLTSLGMRPVETPMVSSAAPGTVVSISPSGQVKLGTTVVIGVAVAPPPPSTTTTTTTTTVPASTPAPGPGPGPGPQAQKKHKGNGH